MIGAAFDFSVYGLAVRSDFELAEVGGAARGKPEVRIRNKPVVVPSGGIRAFRDYRIIADGDLFQYRDIGRFLVRDKGTIDIDLEPCFDRRLASLPILGPVLALLLHRRGLLVLHGSAVLLGDEVHVFLGDKGAGKSTTAAALVASGFPLVSDDVVAIERLPSGVLAVHPGYPAMKLDAEALRRFDSRAYRILEPDGGRYTGGKVRARFLRPVPAGSLRLGKVHCLARGTAHAIEPMPLASKLHALIRFAHHPRLGPAATTAAEARQVFRLAAVLAPQVEVDRLVVQDDLTALDTLGALLAPETACAQNFA